MTPSKLYLKKISVETRQYQFCRSIDYNESSSMSSLNKNCRKEEVRMRLLQTVMSVFSLRYLEHRVAHYIIIQIVHQVKLNGSRLTSRLWYIPHLSLIIAQSTYWRTRVVATESVALHYRTRDGTYGDSYRPLYVVVAVVDAVKDDPSTLLKHIMTHWIPIQAALIAQFYLLII